jgi:NAD(P)-dependent dehydrogenase (short-subunit alcohol dehydrogenase family)
MLSIYNARMSGRLAGRTAVVTGAGRGIGLAIAAAFAREGAKVAICARNAEQLKAAAKETGAFARVCDATVEDQVSAFVADARRELGGVDILVNNAGTLGPMGPLAEVSRADWEATLAGNATSAFLVTREVLRVARPSLVLFLSSGQGRKGTAGWGPYAAGKHAVEALCSVWADEHKGKPVRFISLSPGPTATVMRAAAAPQEDPRTIKSPAAVAEAAVKIALDPAYAGGSLLRLDPGGAILC